MGQTVPPNLVACEAVEPVKLNRTIQGTNNSILKELLFLAIQPLTTLFLTKPMFCYLFPFTHKVSNVRLMIRFIKCWSTRRPHTPTSRSTRRPTSHSFLCNQFKPSRSTRRPTSHSFLFNHSRSGWSTRRPPNLHHRYRR